MTTAVPGETSRSRRHEQEQRLAEPVMQLGRDPHALPIHRQLLGLLVQPGIHDGQRRLVGDTLDQADLLRCEPRLARLLWHWAPGATSVRVCELTSRGWGTRRATAAGACLMLPPLPAG